MSFIPPYPELFKSESRDYVDRPYVLGEKRAWQQCYVCGRVITFDQHGGQWLSIGAGLIRHKVCEPPPLTERRK